VLPSAVSLATFHEGRKGKEKKQTPPGKVKLDREKRKIE